MMEINVLLWYGCGFDCLSAQTIKCLIVWALKQSNPQPYYSNTSNFIIIIYYHMIQCFTIIWLWIWLFERSNNQIFNCLSAQTIKSTASLQQKINDGSRHQPATIMEAISPWFWSANMTMVGHMDPDSRFYYKKVVFLIVWALKQSNCLLIFIPGKLPGRPSGQTLGPGPQARRPPPRPRPGDPTRGLAWLVGHHGPARPTSRLRQTTSKSRGNPANKSRNAWLTHRWVSQLQCKCVGVRSPYETTFLDIDASIVCGLKTTTYDLECW